MLLKTKFLITFLFIFLQISTTSAQSSISPFNYAADIQQVETLLKKEWRRLFWMPEYDHALITSIFKNQHPGDPAAASKHLYISVLKEHAHVYGFITYYYSTQSTGHIELLCVDPGYQGSGYGKKLLSHVEQFFAANNCSLVQLYVYTSNSHAIEFYKHRGFSVKKKIPGCLLLSKELKDASKVYEN